MATFSSNIFYAYSGSVLGADLGLADTNLLNQLSARQSGMIEQTGAAANGSLSSADTGNSPFIDASGNEETFTYLGSGHIALIGFLGLQLGSVPAAAFQTASGQVYLVLPEGPPNFLGLNLSSLTSHRPESAGWLNLYGKARAGSVGEPDEGQHHRNLYQNAHDCNQCCTRVQSKKANCNGHSEFEEI